MEVQRLFENKGFEFLGTNGLIRRTDKHRTYEGKNAPDAFYEDMLATAKECPGEITAIYKTPQILAHSLGVIEFSNFKRFEELAAHAQIRCLFSEMHKSTMDLPMIEARATSQWLPHVWSTFTCGDKHAVVLTKNGKDFTYFVMRSIDIVKADLSEFAARWETAIPLPGRSRVVNETAQERKHAKG